VPVSKFVEKQLIRILSAAFIVRLCNKRCPLSIQ